MGQAWSFNLPYGDELVNTLGGEWALWQQRWNEMEKAINSGRQYVWCAYRNALVSHHPDLGYAHVD